MNNAAAIRKARAYISLQDRKELILVYKIEKSLY